MKRIVILIVLIVLALTMTVHAEKLATFDQVLKPAFLAMDNEQIYVSEGTTVYIFSRKDFSFKKKFGKSGAGPQEFSLAAGGGFSQPGVQVFAQSDNLVVNSIGKVSLFNKDGDFVKEYKSRWGMQSSQFQPFGDGFTGTGAFIDEKTKQVFVTYNLFDGKLEKKTKELTRQKLMKGTRFEMPMTPPMVLAHDQWVVAPTGDDFELAIFDVTGKKVASIKRDYKKLKVGQEYKDGIMQFFKTNPATKAAYEILKKMIKFKDEFPPIQYFFPVDQKVYVLTYLKKDGKYECFVYGINGTFIKRVFIPFHYMSAVQPAPMTIRDGKIYQLLENEDEETWELHGAKI